MKKKERKKAKTKPKKTTPLGGKFSTLKAQRQGGARPS